MQVMRSTIKYISTFLLCLGVMSIMLTSGCGTSDNAPSGATIVISPSTATAAVAGDPTCFQWRVVVSYSNGAPMQNANVTIYGAFAVPAVGPTYQFYLDPNCAYPDAANRPVNSGFTVQTDNSGSYVFSTLTTGAVFTDTIYVYSGTASNSATLTET